MGRASGTPAPPAAPGRRTSARCGWEGGLACTLHGCSGGGSTGAVHSSDYSLWRQDQYASNGLRDFAERGEAWALMKEMQAAGERLQSVHTVFSAPAVPSGTGQTSAELEAHARHSLVSGGRREGVQGVGGLCCWPC